MSEAKSAERIGLLLVHGIGDQNKFQHLQTVGDQIVRALSYEYGADSIAVEMFPGLQHRAPLSILVRTSDDKQICFDVHEMWWRDLGERPKTSALFKFWLWALSLAGTRGYFEKGSGTYENPDNASAKWGGILPRDRIRLFAQTTYFFVLLAPLALVLQLVATIPGVRRVALVRTIFTYLSSVQMYQERRSRQSGSLADFDQSRRTSIQRRMANTILDMAAADYERWYIMAHSLGSVIAFKALMYDGKGFARLLTANRWKDDKFPFRAEKKSENRTPANQGYPDEPKKPMWLEDEGAVDLDKVYAKLRGLITYGSPLETFARTWPAIVQINKDARVSKDFEWLNLHDPVDIVASRLVSFGEASSTGRGEIKPKNILCRASQWVTHAHTSYLATKFRNVDRRILPALLEWMIDGNKTLDSKADSMSRRILPRSGIAGHRMLAILQWILALLIGCLIWPYAASAVVGAVRGIASAATFFLPDILDTINRAHKWVVDNVLTPLFPGIDPIEDAVRIGKLLGVAGIVLAVFGAAHFAIDWWLDRDDRDLSPGADAKTINRMRSIERPSINVEGLR